MLMGCLPTYSQVGILAPILLTVLRLLQGLATGGEFGSSLTFISEYGTPNNRAFLCSWQPFSVGCGLLLGSAAGLLVTTLLPEAALYDWGWRVPFLFGILIAFYGMHMRKNVPDSPEFLKAKAEVKEGHAGDHAESDHVGDDLAADLVAGRLDDGKLGYRGLLLCTSS